MILGKWSRVNLPQINLIQGKLYPGSIWFDQGLHYDLGWQSRIRAKLPPPHTGEWPVACSEWDKSLADFSSVDQLMYALSHIEQVCGFSLEWINWCCFTCAFLECLVTFWAGIQLFTSVDSVMCFQKSLKWECLVTLFPLKSKGCQSFTIFVYWTARVSACANSNRQLTCFACSS